MFRKMRRNAQELDREACEEILSRGTSGVLAVLGDKGYPYAVPLSYVFADGKLYFHCAKQGHKTDAVRACSKASFCVVDRDDVVPEEYTTYFRSVIIFGRARVLEDAAEIRAALETLGRKYHPSDTPEGLARAIDRELAAVAVIELTPEHVTGKEARELAKRRREGR